ncbi:MAG TPA: flippase [Candidatus Paceibacterota bacterium]
MEPNTPRTQLGWRLKNFINGAGFKKYSRSTGWSLGTRIISLVISFFVTLYMVRYLGPENYGQLSYAISFVGIFSILATLGIDTVLYRDLVKHPRQVNEYMGSALGLKLMAGVAATLLAIGGAIALSPKDISFYLIVIISLTYIFNSFNIIAYEFQSHVQQKYPSLIALATTVILNALKVAVFYFDKGIIYLSFILLLESLLYASLYIIFRQKKYGSILAWKFDRRIAVSILKDSWPLLLTSVFAVIYTRIDQVMIKNMLDSESVGLYDAAVRLAEVWNFIPGIIASSLFPAIVNAKRTSTATYKKRVLALSGSLIGLATVVAIPVSLLSGFIINLAYGPEYAASAGVLSIYTWASVCMASSLAMHYFLINENRKGVLFCSSLLAMVVNIALNLYMIPAYGINGAAVATLISYTLLSFPLYYVFKIKPFEEPLNAKA